MSASPFIPLSITVIPANQVGLGTWRTRHGLAPGQTHKTSVNRAPQTCVRRAGACQSGMKGLKRVKRTSSSDIRCQLTPIEQAASPTAISTHYLSHSKELWVLIKDALLVLLVCTDTLFIYHSVILFIIMCYSIHHI